MRLVLTFYRINVNACINDPLFLAAGRAALAVYVDGGGVDDAILDALE